MAGQNFTLSDGATVSASSDGPGNAGDIDIDVKAGSFTIAQGAVVNSGTTGTGAGGGITITPWTLLRLGGPSSGLFSRTTGKDSGAGAGGTFPWWRARTSPLVTGPGCRRAAAARARRGTLISMSRRDHSPLPKVLLWIAARPARAPGGHFLDGGPDTSP